MQGKGKTEARVTFGPEIGTASYLKRALLRDEKM